MHKLIQFPQRSHDVIRGAIALLALGSLLMSGLGACGFIPGFSAQRATWESNVARHTATVQLSPAVLSSPSEIFTPQSSSSVVETAAQITPIRITETQPVQVTSEPKPRCDKAAPGLPIDVTIADGTPMDPGQPFTKIWRLVNAGTCPWTRTYTAEWFSGARLGGPKVIPIDAIVRPGDSMDISVDMVAPQIPGEYQSNWKLRNENKEWFGIGPDGEQVFWVKILVIQESTNTPLPRPTNTTIPTFTPEPTLTPTITPTLTLTPTTIPTPTITLTPTLTSTSSLTGALMIYTTGRSEREISRLSRYKPDNQGQDVKSFLAPLAALHETSLSLYLQLTEGWKQ